MADLLPKNPTPQQREAYNKKHMQLRIDADKQIHMISLDEVRDGSSEHTNSSKGQKSSNNQHLSDDIESQFSHEKILEQDGSFI